MSLKRWLAVTCCLLVAVAAGWTFLVVNYESDLGTANVILVSDASENASMATDDALVVLSFSEADEDLAWSSMQIELVAEDERFTCSFGTQSAASTNATKVTASLSADGSTFTTIVDATDETSFTHLDIPRQTATDEANYTIRMAKTMRLKQPSSCLDAVKMVLPFAFSSLDYVQPLRLLRWESEAEKIRLQMLNFIELKFFVNVQTL